MILNQLLTLEVAIKMQLSTSNLNIYSPSQQSTGAKEGKR
jgi:hypothetical protein